MPFSKPILTPAPRRHDRRAGPRSERLRDALSRPTAPGTRAAGEKRRAYARLQARSDRPERSRFARYAVLLALVAAVALGGRAAWSSEHLVPHAEAPAEYAALVAAVDEACAEPICRFGWGSTRRVPEAIRPLMVRVRVREIDYVAALGRTSLRGAYGADFALHYEAPPTAEQALARRLDTAWRLRVAAETGRPVRAAADLGGGWTRTRGRW